MFLYVLHADSVTYSYKSSSILSINDIVARTAYGCLINPAQLCHCGVGCYSLTVITPQSLN